MVWLARSAVTTPSAPQSLKKFPGAFRHTISKNRDNGEMKLRTAQIDRGQCRVGRKRIAEGRRKSGAFARVDPNVVI